MISELQNCWQSLRLRVIQSFQRCKPYPHKKKIKARLGSQQRGGREFFFLSSTVWEDTEKMINGTKTHTADQVVGEKDTQRSK